MELHLVLEFSDDSGAEEELLESGYVHFVEETPKVTEDQCDIPSQAEPVFDCSQASQSNSQSSQSSRLSRSNASQLKQLTTPLPYIFKTVYKVINLGDLEPPSPTVHERVLRVTQTHEHCTEEIGRYFIKRGFPFIGEGSATLCFLLTEDLVAKVARYTYGITDVRVTEKHFYERNRDLAMHTFFPNGYASSRLMLFIAEGRVYEVFVQERLKGPFIHIGVDTRILSREPNGKVLEEMVWHNQDCKQFARRVKQQMIWNERGNFMANLLVGYDFS